ncbi:unnamed protein product [Vitrella brassicaformis CCMP3155]|uniref:Uncharacterized protein n=1 Tax=Vitrella brassicaformis (strain CCMP3155) TaxID=1169540 RepID=A0A0G4GL12_VITBC|nr:unnamed protein product [Vitrella brassicaformis CCMP3155]|eukprot:CEM30716.1 unnamed protein product [Vitrella brassicaformis CCMP3155]
MSAGPSSAKPAPPMAHATVEQIRQSAYRQSKAQIEQEAKAIAIAQKRSLGAHLKRSELLALVKFIGKDALHMKVMSEASSDSFWLRVQITGEVAKGMSLRLEALAVADQFIADVCFNGEGRRFPTSAAMVDRHVRGDAPPRRGGEHLAIRVCAAMEGCERVAI